MGILGVLSSSQVPRNLATGQRKPPYDAYNDHCGKLTWKIPIVLTHCFHLCIAFGDGYIMRSSMLQLQMWRKSSYCTDISILVRELYQLTQALSVFRGDYWRKVPARETDDCFFRGRRSRSGCVKSWQADGMWEVVLCHVVYVAICCLPRCVMKRFEYDLRKVWYWIWYGILFRSSNKKLHDSSWFISIDPRGTDVFVREGVWKWLGVCSQSIDAAWRSAQCWQFVDAWFSKW